jgi:hypothetical protein
MAPPLGVIGAGGPASMTSKADGPPLPLPLLRCGALGVLGEREEWMVGGPARCRQLPGRRRGVPAAEKQSSPSRPAEHLSPYASWLPWLWPAHSMHRQRLTCKPLHPTIVPPEADPSRPPGTHLNWRGRGPGPPSNHTHSSLRHRLLNGPGSLKCMIKGLFDLLLANPQLSTHADCCFCWRPGRLAVF